MKLDKDKTDVSFRVDTTKDWKGEVYALFPNECSTHSGNVSAYMWVGQHSDVDYGYCIRTSRPATKKEYAELKKHLRQHFGYNLNVVKKQNRNKFLESYYSLNKR